MDDGYNFDDMDPVALAALRVEQVDLLAGLDVRLKAAIAADDDDLVDDLEEEVLAGFDLLAAIDKELVS